MNTRIAIIVAGVLLAPGAFAQDELSFEAISARHPSVRVSDAELGAAQAEGECLAGIKVLGSLPMDEFQPNIEWLNFRTQALLALARPCEVLIMLEAAHNALGTSNAPALTGARSEVDVQLEERLVAVREREAGDAVVRPEADARLQ